MDKQKNTEKPLALTAERLWPVVLTLGKEQMKSLFDFLADYLYPWPENKLMEVHEEVMQGKVLTEAEFQARFADYISSHG